MKRKLFVLGAFWSFGLLGLLCRVRAIQVLLPKAIPGLITVLPGYLLYGLGLKEPLTEAGGGVAWLTAWGVLAFYFLPGGALLYLARPRR